MGKRSTNGHEKKNADLDLIEEQLAALYGGGRSRYVNARITPKTIDALDRIARRLSKAAGRRISRASSLRVTLALGVLAMERIQQVPT